NDLPIKSVGGTVIHVSDVAQVRDGYFPQENIVRQDGVRSTLLSVFKNGSASTLSVAAGVKAAMANILKTVTSDIQVKQFAHHSGVHSAFGVVVSGNPEPARSDNQHHDAWRSGAGRRDPGG